MKRIITLLLLLVCGTAHADIVADTPRGLTVPVASLSSAATRADLAGSTVRVRSSLSAVMSNISSASVHQWPADRKLTVEKGGSIGNTTRFTFADGASFVAGTHKAFAGTGSVTGLKEARPEWWTDNTTPGTTDMGAAINKALTAAPVVKLQTGKYATTVEIPLINGRKLQGSGMTWWQDSSSPPSGSNETILVYTGAGGANSTVVRMSTAAVGTKPTYPTGNNFGVGIENLIIDGNNLAEIGLYSARSGLGSIYRNIAVTGTKEHGFWFGEFWTCAVRDIYATWNYGAGVTIGVDTFSWGSNAVNAVEFDNIQAYQNGRDLAAWTTADYMSGYGIAFAGGRNNIIHNAVSEENNGVGLVWASTSGPNIIDSWYSEDNCKIAASKLNRYAMWFQSNSGSVLSTIRNVYVLYNGSVGLTDAPKIRLTGTPVSNAAEVPVLDGVFGGAVIESDFGAYKVTKTALASTYRIISHLPQYSDPDTVTLEFGSATGAWNSGTTYTVGQTATNGGYTWIAAAGSTNQTPADESVYWSKLAWTSGTIYAAADGTGTGDKSGRDTANTMPLSQVTRVLRGVTNITTVNVSALTGTLASALTLDGIGINRRITIDGATTGRFTSVSGVGFTLKNWAQELYVTDMAVTELLNIYDSKTVLNNCVLMRMNTGSTLGAALSVYNSNVQVLGTSAINVTGSSAATKIGINLYGGSTVWFSGAAATVISGESTSKNVVFGGVAAVKDSTGWILATF